MSILIDKDTRLLVQGITGRDGSFHTKAMQDYGTNIVAGVTPGKGGSSVYGIEVFNTVKEAVAKTQPDASVVYVPAPSAPDALYEAIEAGLRLIVCISEGIPVLDVLEVCSYAKYKGVRLIGPNSPGVISPGKSKIGIMPGSIHRQGKVGVISRSGTLTYEVVYGITQAGLGQSTVIGIGGDAVVGSDFVELLELFDQDSQTEAVVLIGEIGGSLEEEAASYVKTKMSKPVFGFIAGKTAPVGKRMGHAGAIIAGDRDRAVDKIKLWQDAGVTVVDRPDRFVEKIKECLV